MKKILTLAAVLVMSLTAFAQVAVWTTNIHNHWDDEAQKYIENQKDTFVGVSQLLNVSEIDSMRIKNSDYNEGEKDLWIYMKKPSLSSYAVYSLYHQYHYESIYGVDAGLYSTDSIVWQPYAVKGIACKSQYKNREVADSIIMPLRTMQTYFTPNDEYVVSTDAVQPVPAYAVASDATVEVENESVCKVVNDGYFYSEHRNYNYNYGLQLSLYPYAVGQTNLKVTMGGITRNFPIIIEPKEEIEDVDYDSDSLFNKIYSRMTETGERHPDGQPDIQGDEGAISLTRLTSYMNDIASDQTYWVWADPGIDDIRHNKWKVENNVLDYMFQRLYYNIYLCNSFLSRPNTGDEVRAAEVRFIRAYLYSQLLDFFGNVPIVTKNADFFTAPQATRAQVYEFVVSELLAVEQTLPAEKVDYYRVDKTAAWLLLSRIYLNSEVYAGTQDYTLAAQYAYKAISSSYSLCANYRNLFMGDNDLNGAQSECIWALRQVGAEHSSWGGSKYLVAAYADGNEDVGISDTWRCINARTNLVDLFNISASETYGDYQTIPGEVGDDRALFTRSNSWSVGKWTIHKWTNERTDNGIRTDPSWPDTDIPLFRLAEAYLNYAEAVLRGGAEQGGMTALEAVNAVRARAHAENAESVDLQYVLDERGREFYAEGMRRTDLVRFNKYGGNTGYKWPYKNGSATGSDFDEYRNLYPIPANICKQNPSLVQNPGY